MPVDPIALYLSVLKERGVALTTLKATQSDLAHLIRWWEVKHRRSFAPAYLIDRDLREWKAARQKVDGVAPSTINRALSTIRRFCAWATAQGWVVENPALGLADVPAATLSPRFLPDEAVDALLRRAHAEKDSTLRSRDEAMLALLVYAGLRAQEVCDVQLRDLDVAGGTLVVRSGKGSKVRRIPLHLDAQHLLSRYLSHVRCPSGLAPIGSDEEREPLLVGVQITLQGQPTRPGITTGLVRQRVRLLGRRAAAQLREAAKREQEQERVDRLNALAQLLDGVSPHLLRHSLARRMLRRGAQLSEVQRVLGHSRLSTTGIYLTPSEDDLRAAIGRAGV